MSKKFKISASSDEQLAILNLAAKVCERADIRAAEDIEVGDLVTDGPHSHWVRVERVWLVSGTIEIYDARGLYMSLRPISDVYSLRLPGDGSGS